ncbi:MAG: hypothetical protein R6U66_04000 [Bacteroidales bacterium]
MTEQFRQIISFFEQKDFQKLKEISKKPETYNEKGIQELTEMLLASKSENIKEYEKKLQKFKEFALKENNLDFINYYHIRKHLLH